MIFIASEIAFDIGLVQSQLKPVKIVPRGHKFDFENIIIISNP